MNLAKEILINKGLPAGKLDEEFAFQKQIFNIFKQKREKQFKNYSWLILHTYFY